MKELSKKEINKEKKEGPPTPFSTLSIKSGGGIDSPPDSIHVGAGALYRSVRALASALGVTETGMRRIASGLKLPVVTFDENPLEYINLYALESGLFEIGATGEMRREKTLLRLHHETAALIYGTLTQEMVRKRVERLGKSLRKSVTPKKRKRKS